MEEKIRVRATIIGRVQGVFFRMETQKAANRYGVTGWVRNNMDGTVEALFEGNKENVDQVLNWCRKGPALSRVEKVIEIHEDYTGEFRNFNIRY
jgi:acylphosphatase